jgi:hypothetical protein
LLARAGISDRKGDGLVLCVLLMALPVEVIIDPSSARRGSFLHVLPSV